MANRVRASKQRRGADVMVSVRINPQLLEGLEKAWNHKLKRDRLNPKSYGFSTFVREMAGEGLKLYSEANADDF